MEYIVYFFTVLIAFSINWLLYHYSANLLIFDGVSKRKSFLVTVFEFFYIFMAVSISFIPYIGFVLGTLMFLALPIYMISTIKRIYGILFVPAIGIYIIALLGDIVLLLPHFIL